MRPLALALCALSLIASPAAPAAEEAAGPQGQVRAVQPPAWLKRGERVVAIRPGLIFRAGDELFTGESGRLHVAAPDGSQVQIGADTRLVMNQFGGRREGEVTVFAAIMDLYVGEVRFTGNLRPDLRQEVRFQTPGIVVDSDGRDLLLDVDAEGQRVTLLDGQARVLTGSAEPLPMSEPRTTLYHDAEGGLSAVEGAPAEQVGALREAVALIEDRPVLDQGGPWQLVLFSVTNRENAVARAQELIREGYPIALDEFERDGTVFHRVIVPDLRAQPDARLMSESVAERFGYEDAWIKRADQ